MIYSKGDRRAGQHDAELARTGRHTHFTRSAEIGVAGAQRCLDITVRYDGGLTGVDDQSAGILAVGRQCRSPVEARQRTPVSGRPYARQFLQYGLSLEWPRRIDRLDIDPNDCPAEFFLPSRKPRALGKIVCREM